MSPRRPALLSLAAIFALTVATAACGSTSSSSSHPSFTPTTQSFNAAGSPSDAAGSPSSAAGAPSAAAGSPSSAPCLTHACIVQIAEQSMVGTTAKDGSVITKAVCYKSTVQYSSAANTYTVSCDITYTDGSTWHGLVTLLENSDQVSWQPQYQD